MIERDEFVEWAEVHGNFYGSPRAAVERGARARPDRRLRHRRAGGPIDQAAGTPTRCWSSCSRPRMAELERRLRERRHGRARTRSAGACWPPAREMERGIGAYDYMRGERLRWSAPTSELDAIVAAERCRRGRVDLPRPPLGSPKRCGAGVDTGASLKSRSEPRRCDGRRRSTGPGRGSTIAARRRRRPGRSSRRSLRSAVDGPVADGEEPQATLRVDRVGNSERSAEGRTPRTKHPGWRRVEAAPLREAAGNDRYGWSLLDAASLNVSRGCRPLREGQPPKPTVESGRPASRTA